MAALKRLTRKGLLPWAALQYWRVWRAWSRDDWKAMVTLLRAMSDAGLHDSGDHVLLALALARLGQFPEWYFEQVNREDLYRAQYAIYFNEYAYALARSGDATTAGELLRSTMRDHWPESQRRWADDFLASGQSQSAPPRQHVRPHLLH